MKTRIQSRVVTYDSKNKSVLLVRNHGRKFWCAPGGGLEDDEDVKQCAVREMLEETGMHIDIKRMLYVQELHDEKEAMIIIELFWLAELSHEQVLDNNHVDFDLDEGIEEARWFTKKELQNITVYPITLKDAFWNNIHQLRQEDDPFIGVFK